MIIQTNKDAMTVLREEPSLGIWLLCILLCTDLQTDEIMAMRGDTTIYHQGNCKAYKHAEGTSLWCYQAPFADVLRAARAAGEELVEIKVTDCYPRPIVSLNRSCFAHNTKLTKITLWECGVANVADDTFADFKYLNELDLSGNVISAFTTETFSGLGNLLKLALDRNQIIELKTKVFANLVSLTHLDVSYNKITRIDNDTFHNLTRLTALDLSNNLIVYIDHRAFSGLDSVNILDLGSNNIRHIQNETFKSIENVISLSLTGNQNLQLQDDVFKDLGLLQVLLLKDIPYLYTDNRRLSLFRGLRNLELLDLSKVELTNLEYGDLKARFKDQRNSLKTIYFQGTSFTNGLLEMTKDLSGLVSLYLNDNDIGYITKSSLPKLVGQEILHLENNKITFVDEDAFEGMERGQVWLATNPLDCSCKHASFSRWLRSDKGAIVLDRDWLTCGSPIDLYGTIVMDYDPYWWQCSQYMPLIALVFIVGFLLIVVLIILIVYCNRINLKHWLLERRVASNPPEEEQDAEPPTESGPLLNPALCRNSLRQGKTGAYIIHDFYETPMLDWVNKYVEDQLFRHPMKITLQFPAGPEVIPLWKQIKDFSFQVNSFLVLVTDGFLANHWPEIAEKSGVDNIMKCVFVLHGKKTSELPKEMKRLQCPCFQWPETGTRFTTLERERDQFWKQVRIAIKVSK